MKKPFTIALLAVSAPALFGQSPRPLVGVQHGWSNGRYSGFESTIIREDLYPDTTYLFEQLDARERRTLGLRLVLPALTLTIAKDKSDEKRPSVFDPFKSIGGSWRSPNANDPKWAAGIGVDLVVDLRWNRAKVRTYDSWSSADGANNADYRFASKINDLEYLVWLNYDYLDLDMVGRLKFWGIVPIDSLRRGKALLDFFHPMQFFIDWGISMNVPLTKNGIYYKSNDATIGIDEQVTSNLNDVIRPMNGVACLGGLGFRIGRFDFTWRNRVGTRDVLKVLGNTYNFSETDNEFSTVKKEFLLTVYLGGGASN